MVWPQRICAVLLCTFWAHFVQACQSVLLVSSNNHFNIVHRIEAELFAQPHFKAHLTHLTADNIKSADFFKDDTHTCLIVAIGAKALSVVSNTNTAIPIFSILTRKNAFKQLLQKAHRHPNDPLRPISAIYLDQPLARQMQLISLLVPEKEKQPIGVLLGAQSYEEKENLQNLAKHYQLNLTTVYVNQSENPATVLNTLLEEVRLLFSIPDSEIYNPHTSKGILLTAFHKKVPIIGYSRTYVKLGALGAIYSTSKQLAQQTAEEIMNIIQNNNKLPPLQYPRDYTIALNFQVAKAMGLEIKDEITIKSLMKKNNSMLGTPRMSHD